MTRRLGGEKGLKAEVFETPNGSRLGHCTVKGRTAANRVYGKLDEQRKHQISQEAENFCVQGWNGQRVRVSLVVLEKPGVLKTLEGPKKSRGAFLETTVSPSPTYPGLNIPGPQAVVTEGHPDSSRYDSPSGRKVFLLTRSSQNIYSGSLNFAAITYNQRYDRMAPYTAHPGAIYTYPVGNAPQLSSVHVGQTRYPYQTTTTVYTVDCASPAHSQYKTAARPSRVNTLKSSELIRLAYSRIPNGSTIFLSGLPPDQPESQLRGLLKQYGPLVYLEIHPDGRNPAKAKGTARARYASSAEALSAVCGLDGAYLSKNKISVQQEKADQMAFLRPWSKTDLASVATQKRTDQIKPVQVTGNLSVQVHPPRASIDTGSTGSTSPTTL